ncbi:MAG: zinc carboxypeptidase [Bacteroidetes bacterium]|nr:MAG: zinc carboxypeptidase [Bacteroidota bacterium]
MRFVQVLIFFGVLCPLSFVLHAQNGRGEWSVYPTYEEYVQQMEGFASDYPDLCTLVCFDTLNSGRQLLAITFNKGIATASDVRPKVLFTSTMHGDETVGYVLMLHLIDSLLSGYGTDPFATFLVDSLNVWINPNANPDGTYRAGNHTVSGARRYNLNGVDLNRNYPDPQDGPHPDGRVWQEETIAFMDLAEEVGFDLGVNIHGGAEVCNYPWDTWSKMPADLLWWQKVCNMYADTAQYYSPSGYLDDFGTGVVNGYSWYSINGSRQDYMNWFHQCREFTLELSRRKNPPPQTLEDYWSYNHRSFFNYMKQAWYGLHGVVTDSLTGEPLRAKVFIPGYDVDSSWVYSDALNGDYHRYLITGTYTLTFTAPGYLPKTVSLAVNDTLKTLLNVQLMPEEPLTQLLSFPAGWSGFSTYLDLLNDSTQALFGGLADTLIIVKDMYDVYWPPQINNLPVLSPGKGYVVKMNHETSVAFSGYSSSFSSVPLNEGWNLVAVMVADSISSDLLFTPVYEQLVMAKSFDGGQVFWPEAGINTMPYLYAGRAYFVKVKEACLLNFVSP